MYVSLCISVCAQLCICIGVGVCVCMDMLRRVSDSECVQMYPLVQEKPSG